MDHKFLALGIDTLVVSYYLDTKNPSFSFEKLAVIRDSMDSRKHKDGKKIKLGNREFLLKGGGTISGYSFKIRDNDFIIEFGEFNNPSFYVKFLSKPLWHKGYLAMHHEFLRWAKSLGLEAIRPETISRVDACLDYQIQDKDFGEENFVSKFEIDSKYRGHRKDQTYNFGIGTCVRIYNKSIEVAKKGKKTWFYDIWKETDNVWRIEWQLSNDYLKRHGLRSLDDLRQSVGFVLCGLCEHHTSLRLISNDTNRSRWEMHPLWLDVMERYKLFGQQPIRALPRLQRDYPERVQRIIISLMGNVKAIAALSSVYDDTSPQSFSNIMTNVNDHLNEIHDPVSWQEDVQNKMDKLRLADV